MHSLAVIYNWSIASIEKVYKNLKKRVLIMSSIRVCLEVPAPYHVDMQKSPLLLLILGA